MSSIHNKYHIIIYKSGQVCDCRMYSTKPNLTFTSARAINQLEMRAKTLMCETGSLFLGVTWVAPVQLKYLGARNFTSRLGFCRFASKSQWFGVTWSRERYFLFCGGN